MVRKGRMVSWQTQKILKPSCKIQHSPYLLMPVPLVASGKNIVVDVIAEKGYCSAKGIMKISVDNEEIEER
jgi:hypothetical protein